MAITTVDAEFVVSHLDEIPIIDVRTSSEYVQGHIPGSVNVALDSVGPTDDFLEKMAELVRAEDRPLIVYCRSGIRAGRAARVLERAGYEHIFTYDGSWLDWTKDPTRPTEM